MLRKTLRNIFSLFLFYTFRKIKSTFRGIKQRIAYIDNNIYKIEICLNFEDTKIKELIYKYSNYLVDVDNNGIYFNYSKMPKSIRRMFKEDIKKLKLNTVEYKPIIIKVIDFRKKE